MIATMVICINFANLYTWIGRYSNRREPFHILLVASIVGLICHGIDRIVANGIKRCWSSIEVQLGVDVFRSFLGQLIHSWVCILTYLRLKAVMSASLGGHRYFKHINYVIMALVYGGALAAVAITIFREYLEIAFYGSEDDVFDGVRVILSSVLQGYLVVVEGLLTSCFLYCLKKSTMVNKKTETASAARQRKMFYYENIFGCLFLLGLAVGYMFNVNNKRQPLSTLLQLLSSCSIAFLFRMMQALSDGAHKGQTTHMNVSQTASVTSSSTPATKSKDATSTNV